MFVHPLRRGTQSAAIVVGIGVAAFAGACGDPTLKTDLRPDGPPEVLSVLVLNDSVYDIVEGATFCKPNDDKRPEQVSAPPVVDPTDFTSVQVCPVDLTAGAQEVGTTTGTGADAVTVAGALPSDFWVRIMFDELLDPSVEDLVTDDTDNTTSGTLRNTQPVTFKCNGVDVQYDGFYDPSGDGETWPLGPSLRIEPLASEFPAIATGAECTVSIKDGAITDKDGNPVPTAELGPFTFKVAALELVDQSPEPPDDVTSPDTEDPAAPIQLLFNAYPSASSLSPSNISLTIVSDCTATGTVISTETAVVAVDAMDPTVLDISDAAAPTGDALKPSVTYSISFATGTTVSDSADASPGSVDVSDVATCFKTDAGS